MKRYLFALSLLYCGCGNLILEETGQPPKPRKTRYYIERYAADGRVVEKIDVRGMPWSEESHVWFTDNETGKDRRIYGSFSVRER